eukprot:97333-Rhodomonas_salina.1
MDSIWSELGSSELKQQSLLQPKNVDHLMPLDRVIQVQQHPSLFEEGKVLQSGNRKLVRDTIERYTREVDDDGLRTISAQDYLDIRASQCASMPPHCVQADGRWIMIALLASAPTGVLSSACPSGA